MDLQRYNRQIILPNFGEKAQKKLWNASVLVVGAGGLGCPVLQYLATAGVGTLGVVDYDKVEESNLHRQILFEESGIDLLKAEVAKDKLEKLNSNLKVKAYPHPLTLENVFSIIDSYDIVVDCTDNFSIRYLLSDVCYLQKKPLVYGAIYQYQGQVAVFNVEKEDRMTNYRDLFPLPPQPDEIPNCNEAGVIGTLSGMVGTMQANEVIKLITGIGDVLIHKLLLINMLDYHTSIIKYPKSKFNTSPQTQEELKPENYTETCKLVQDTDVKSLRELEDLLKDDQALLIDVRNEDEMPRIQLKKCKSIPLGRLKNEFQELEKYERIIFICQSGIRSQKALEITKAQYPDKKIQQVSGGIKTIL